jgi:hypothetical protein
MYQFVLWGYGRRGKRFFDFCKKEHIKAIIDTNINLQGGVVENIPIISYEKYKSQYSKYDILVTVEVYEEIINMMKEDHIHNYFLLKECPHEFRGYEKELWFEQLPIRIDSGHKYMIYGLNIYSILLREYICKKIGTNEVGIVPETKRKEDIFLPKYDFVISSQILDKKDNFDLLIACKSYAENREYKIQNVFWFDHQFEKNYSPEIDMLRDKHKGQKCFIVATGPSIRAEDLERLGASNYVCFGVNKIYLSFDKTSWRPEYLVATDEKFIAYYDEMLHSGVKNVIISDLLPEVAQKGRQEGAIVFHSIIDENGLPEFSEEPMWKLYSVGSVVYECLQLAIYMGFSEIYLLGTDHNYSENQLEKTNHFHKNYYTGIGKPNQYVKEHVERAFQSAKLYAENHGIKIYNATRGGKLEIFERADFDLLMNKGENK